MKYLFLSFHQLELVAPRRKWLGTKVSVLFTQYLIYQEKKYSFLIGRFDLDDVELQGTIVFFSLAKAFAKSFDQG